MFELIVIVSSLPVSLLPSHPINSYPSFAVAVIVTSVSSAYVPPSEDTEPPSELETDRVYSTVSVPGSGI